MSASPTVIDYTAAAPLPCERYGLRLVEEPAPTAPRTDAPSGDRPMRPFDWGLLAGLAAVQLAHLAGLAVFARWALRRLIGV